MRKLIRGVIKSRAEKSDIKTSTYVHDCFEQLQIHRYGIKNVAINRARGTHKKKNWSNRIWGAVG